MSRELSIWCAHGSPGDLGVFRHVAELRGYLRDVPGYSDHVESIATGDDLLSVIAAQRGGEGISHLVLAGHGGTTWWGSSTHGVTTGRPRRGGQVSVSALADVLADVLTMDPLISIASCMCSRSPAWYLRTRWGRDIGSDWGRRAYLPGGQASFSARLRDHLWWHGIRARVRGHRASGHASALALLAEHRWPAAEPCETLFGAALDGVEPDILARRWWVRTVTGDLAQRWLMGDDTVPSQIRQRWLDEN